MKTFCLSLLALLFAARLSSQSTYYFTVKFPDDVTVHGCGVSAADTIWPVISSTPNCSFGVGVAVKDQIFYTNGNACGKILRRWRLLYWCDYDPNWGPYNIVYNPANSDIGPTVVANSGNHGYLEYTQIIKVLDDGAPKFIGCPTTPVTFCDYSTNDPTQYNKNHMDLCEGVVNLSTKVTDQCSKSNVCLTYRMWLDLNGDGIAETFRSSSDSLAWPIETSVVADTLRGRVKFPPGMGLPYGKNMIEWIAMDGCGNQSYCKYQFIVKDCAPPTVICHNGLSVNIMETGMITLWANDFVKKKFDNCSAENQIKVAIRKSGMGTGFPLTGAVTFDCNELGIQYVEVWVRDAYGNATYCETFVDVQDPFGACPTPNPFGNSGGGSDPAFAGERGAFEGFGEAIFQAARPNPAKGSTILPFWLPEAADLRVTLSDATGRVLFAGQNFYEKGDNQIVFDLRNLNAQGLVWLRVESGAQVSVQRVMVAEF